MSGLDIYIIRHGCVESCQSVLTPQTPARVSHQRSSRNDASALMARHATEGSVDVPEAVRRGSPTEHNAASEALASLQQKADEKSGLETGFVLKNIIETHHLKPELDRLIFFGDEKLGKDIRDNFPEFSLDSFSKTMQLFQDIKGLPQDDPGVFEKYFLPLSSALYSIQTDAYHPILIAGRTIGSIKSLKRQIRACGVLLLCLIWVFVFKSIKDRYEIKKVQSLYQKRIENIARHILGDHTPLIDPVKQVRQYVSARANHSYLNVDVVSDLLRLIYSMVENRVTINEMHINENNNVTLIGLADNELAFNDLIQTMKKSEILSVTINDNRISENGLEFDICVAMGKDSYQ